MFRDVCRFYWWSWRYVMAWIRCSQSSHAPRCPQPRVRCISRSYNGHTDLQLERLQHVTMLAEEFSKQKLHMLRPPLLPLLPPRPAPPRPPPVPALWVVLRFSGREWTRNGAEWKQRMKIRGNNREWWTKEFLLPPVLPTRLKNP